MPRELPGLYKRRGAASKCSNHVDVLLKRFLKPAGVGGEEEVVVVEEVEAGGGEREKAHAERRCGCSAPILTEPAHSSRTWDCPAAANPSPGPDTPNRRGSPVTKVAAGAGQRARGVGTGSRAQKFLP